MQAAIDASIADQELLYQQVLVDAADAKKRAAPAPHSPLKVKKARVEISLLSDDEEEPQPPPLPSSKLLKKPEGKGAVEGKAARREDARLQRLAAQSARAGLSPLPSLSSLPSGPEPVSGGAGLMADPLEEEEAADEEKARILAAIQKADLEEPGDWIHSDSPMSSDTEVEEEEDQPSWPKTPPSSPPHPPEHQCSGCQATFVGKVIRLLDDEQHFGEYCCFQCVVDHLRQEHAN